MSIPPDGRESNPDLCSLPCLRTKLWHQSSNQKVWKPLIFREGELSLKHPITVEPLTEAIYRHFVKAPTAKGNYPSTLSSFLVKHPGASHGVFDAEGRLIYIGKEADLRAAHRKQ